MKIEPDKRNRIPYTITITTQFELFMTKKEADEGAEIPQDLIEEQVMKNVQAGEYDVQEDAME